MKFTETTVKGKPVFKIDGKPVSKKEYDRAIEAARPKVTPPAKFKDKRCGRGYPIKLVSMAVTTHRRAKMMQECVTRGVPTEYTKNGRPIIRDAAHYKQFRRAFGLHQRNSYDD